jgi:protein disulfide-isomerase
MAVVTSHLSYLTILVFRFLLGLVVIFGVFGCGQPEANDEDLGWIKKHAEAIAASKKSGLPMLVNFTGSDWCGWCVKLHKEVFATKEFKEWAATNVVLLELDFPNKKAQDAAIKAKNEELAKQYKVEGYPTILILDGTGKKIGELGYVAGGPTVWIAEFTKQYKAGGGK